MTTKIVQDHSRYDIEQGGDAKPRSTMRQSSTSMMATSCPGQMLQIEAAAALVPDKDEAGHRVCACITSSRFAEDPERNAVTDIEIEVDPGPVSLGQKSDSGRNSRVAICPARPLQSHRQRYHDRNDCKGGWLQDHIIGLFAATALVSALQSGDCSMRRRYCGADKILAMGGVQGVAAMTFRSLSDYPRRIFWSVPETSSWQKPSAYCSAGSAST